MLKIGEFSKISRVSVRMLRHYDEIGLLKPVETDSFTGYRYYSESQLTKIGLIKSLKELGFSLADIIKMTEICDDIEKMDSFYKKRQIELQNQADITAHQMMLLDTARKRLRKEQKMSYNVSIKTIPERYAATVHMTIPHYDDEGMVWQVLCEETDSMNMIPDDPCLVAADPRLPRIFGLHHLTRLYLQIASVIETIQLGLIFQCSLKQLIVPNLGCHSGKHLIFRTQ